MSRQSSHKRNFFKALTGSALKGSQKLRLGLKSSLIILGESVPFLIACAVLVSVISLNSPILLFCLLVGSLIAVITQQIGQQVNLPRRSLIILQILAAAVILSLYWLDWFAAPAQAQFFGEAEKFFKTRLGGSTGNSDANVPITLIFSVLRAIYLLYIAISLVGVINAVRKDEDWQSIARTPLLVVVAVTIADVLTRFVIGPQG
ncbi:MULTISPECIES: hypothetical protein [unclassified Nostoc]|uniref:hypothetical protein n=1 Tax=unclassified Nostoc TaxID=2593658 RepID=UPI002AD23D65|nr:MULTISPECIES: hypothetical protein [unclassified Nostoc]MDZ8125438.1 hypothetical protein [Nostoc sp. CmiVER01]MDZ8222074.1 hypothetical protein [Nostoc sp. ChiVER01]